MTANSTATARTATALSASALLLLALMGCTTGSGGAATDEPGTGTDTGTDTDTGTGTGTEETVDEELGGDATASCLARTWELDTADLAAQLGESLGPNVTQSEASGTQTFTLAPDGAATAAIDVTYTVTIDDGDIAITVVQTHSGTPSGQWRFSDAGESVLAFDDWDNSSYRIQNSIIVAGTEADTPTDLPTEDLSTSEMSVECSGDTLTTQVEGSPFTHHWTAG